MYFLFSWFKDCSFLFSLTQNVLKASRRKTCEHNTIHDNEAGFVSRCQVSWPLSLSSQPRAACLCHMHSHHTSTWTCHHIYESIESCRQYTTANRLWWNASKRWLPIWRKKKCFPLLSPLIGLDHRSSSNNAAGFTGLIDVFLKKQFVFIYGDRWDSICLWRHPHSSQSEGRKENQ